MERADQNEQPMVYALDHGFLMRVSALVNSQHHIEVSSFGAVKEGQFLPSPLLADHNWQDEFFPLGHVAVSPVVPFKVMISSRSYGETDDFGYNIARDPVEVHDLHATLLRCLGIDHTRLTYLYQGRHYRLTDVRGNVVRELLA